MSSYITRRYAALLTKYDTQMLFSWLSEAYGSISKAAEVTKVQRKTIYDWDTSSEDIRLETRKKVLEQNMKLDENRTLEFLIRKTDNDLREVLQHYLRGIFENSIKADSEKKFLRYASLFREVQRNHRGAVFDIPEDITEMNQAITVRAKDFGIDLPELPVDLIPPEILAEKIKAFLKVLETRKLTIDEMKKSFDLSSGLIDDICKTLNYLGPGKVAFDHHIVRLGGPWVGFPERGEILIPGKLIQEGLHSNLDIPRRLARKEV